MGGNATIVNVALHVTPLCPAGHLPLKGEIGSFDAGSLLATLKIGESGRHGRSPPLRGRCPAGQRGARRITGSRSLLPRRARPHPHEHPRHRHRRQPLRRLHLRRRRGTELARSVRDIGKGHAEILMDVIQEALDAAGIVLPRPRRHRRLRRPRFLHRRPRRRLGGARPGAGAENPCRRRQHARSAGLRDARGARAPSACSRRSTAAATASTRLFTMNSHKSSMLRSWDNSTRSWNWHPARRHSPAPPRPASRPPRPRTNFLFGPLAATADIATYARIALAGGFAGGRPQPLYLRAPDARPQAHLALPRRDG